MIRYFTILLLFLTISPLFAQISDNFDDGDFTNAPTWSGTDADFQVNASNQVQLNAAMAGTSYLSLPHALTDLDDKEWRFDIRQNFSPSGGNFGKVYLAAASADLSTDPDGIYLLFGEGGAADAIRLIKRELSVDTEILAGTAALIASSFDFSVRVTRDAAGLWSLFYDPAGGDSYQLEASATDAFSTVGTHFGFLDVYTSSNSTKFYFDEVYIGDIIVDLTPPTVASLTVVSSTELDVLFDEAVDVTTAQTLTNYTVDNGIGNPSSAVVDGSNSALVHLTFATPFTIGQAYNLSVQNVEDLNANVMVTEVLPYQYLIAEVPEPGDVLINEFICDPTPAVGLPEVEFVEIYNRSTKYFNVNGWKIGDASSFGTISDAWLNPGEHMILIATGSAADYPTGVTVSSFPSLNNSGDDIILQSDLLLEIDKISYTNDWYNNPNKEDGGYSIERINPTLVCSGINNWMASEGINGGTPGAQNSLYSNTPDLTSPVLVSINALAPNFVNITFNEGMDSTSLADALVTFNPVLTEANRYVLEEFTTDITFEFVENIVPGTFYDITLDAPSDCGGNMSTITSTFILPAPSSGAELKINEILFDPFTGATDFVELYNASDSYVDVKDWQIANYDDDTIANIELVTQNFLMAPGDYVVLTEDSITVLSNYPYAVPGTFIEMDLPNFNSDSSTVYLMINNVVSEKVSYEDDWHFRLLDSKDGKSLERLDVTQPVNESSNWHTASEAVGFATPGRVNSQYNEVVFDGEFNLSANVFSPDNDGFEDVLLINYEMPAPDMLATISIYDDFGRLKKQLISNELLGTSGSFKWDGDTDDQTKASIGQYIISIEAFDIDGGAVYQDRKVVTVAGKF